MQFFFFQAEDGIRDLTVTGVQTCALPISYLPPLGPEWYDVGRADDTEESRNRVIPAGRGRRRFADAQQHNVRLDKWASPARAFPADRGRSEERRVGKEGRSRWSPDH